MYICDDVYLPPPPTITTTTTTSTSNSIDMNIEKSQDPPRGLRGRCPRGEEEGGKNRIFLLLDAQAGGDLQRSPSVPADLWIVCGILILFFYDFIYY